MASVDNEIITGGKKGGYFLLDLSGVNVRQEGAQEITKEQYDSAVAACSVRKPIFIINTTMGNDEDNNTIIPTPISVVGFVLHFEDIIVVELTGSGFTLEISPDPITSKYHVSVSGN